MTDGFKLEDHGICNAADYYGHKVTAAKIEEDCLLLTLSNGKIIQLLDDGQDCCEHRYMTTDDDVSSIVGGDLLLVEAVKADDQGDHEQVFVKVETSKGFITIANHNVHNGFYSGFFLMVKEVES